MLDAAVDDVDDIDDVDDFDDDKHVTGDHGATSAARAAGAVQVGPWVLSNAAVLHVALHLHGTLAFDALKDQAARQPFSADDLVNLALAVKIAAQVPGTAQLLCIHGGGGAR